MNTTVVANRRKKHFQCHITTCLNGPFFHPKIITEERL